MKKLLLCLAHPDDESFVTGGTIAKYVDMGWNVELVCATRGAAGQTGPLGTMVPEQLGVTREQELRSAAQALGISEVTIFDYMDGKLQDISPGEIEEPMFQKMKDTMPDVVITFDTLGFTNHPDHMRMSYSTTYAFQKYAIWVHAQLAGNPEVLAEVEPKLYYACMPDREVRYLQEHKAIAKESFGKPWIGTPDKLVTTVIDISAYAEKKREAILCHVSQQVDVDRFLSFANQPFMKHEFFIHRMQGREEVFMGKLDRVAEEL